MQKSKPNKKKATRDSEVRGDHLKMWSEYLRVTEEQLRAAIKTLIH